ncbi:hypothetical protein [Paeniglutamicibacter sp.]|uniref:hypothetical protein n=1 Tax=Paeniglutamicibacter sp. TaxID=1934391 RepID=UPI00398935B4
MSTSTEAFPVHPFIDNTAAARHLARRRKVRTAAHVAPRHRMVASLWHTSPRQEELLRENRERAWVQLSQVVAGRY